MPLSIHLVQGPVQENEISPSGGWVVGIEAPVQREFIPQAEQGIGGVGEGRGHGGFLLFLRVDHLARMR